MQYCDQYIFEVKTTRIIRFTSNGEESVQDVRRS